MADHSDWTLDQYARHYAETLAAPPNGWGQHVSPVFGQSHFIMIAAGKHYPREAVERAFAKAVREKESKNG